MIFVITEIVCIPTGTSTTLRKNRSMRVPIYIIDSIAPRTSIQIRQSGPTGILTGVTGLSKSPGEVPYGFLFFPYYGLQRTNVPFLPYEQRYWEMNMVQSSLNEFIEL